MAQVVERFADLVGALEVRSTRWAVEQECR